MFIVPVVVWFHQNVNAIKTKKNMSNFYENVRDNLGRTTATIINQEPERKYIDEKWKQYTYAIAQHVYNSCNRMTIYETRNFIRKNYSIPTGLENEIIFYVDCFEKGKFDLIKNALAIEVETVGHKIDIKTPTVATKSATAANSIKKKAAETPKNSGYERFAQKNDLLYVGGKVGKKKGFVTPENIYKKSKNKKNI